MHFGKNFAFYLINLYIGQNKIKFVSLKKILPILFIILSASFCSEGQSRSSSIPGDGIVRFYPNPAISSITFDLPKGYEKNYSLEVFSFLGRKVYEAINVNPHTTVDLTDFIRGVYIYQLRDKSGKMVESGKFQVSK